MCCQFRFVTQQDPQKVALRLFVDRDGVARGEILGPLMEERRRRLAQAVDRCLVTLEVALMAAIRIANTNDTEIVVLGDPRLWNPQWGVLDLTRRQRRHRRLTTLTTR